MNSNLTLNLRYAEDDNAAKASTTAAPVKVEEPVPAVAKTEDALEQGNQNDGGDEQMYNADQDGDDDIDFNLGNGNDYQSPPAQQQHAQEHQPIGIKEDG